MKAVPVISHPPIPSSKSKLQATIEKKKNTEFFIPQNTLWLHLVLSLIYRFVLNYFYCSMRQWTLKDICNEILYRCIQHDKFHCWNKDCCCMDSVQDKRTAYYKCLWLVIIYSKVTQSCWSDNFFMLFDQVKTRISYTCWSLNQKIGRSSYWIFRWSSSGWFI